MRYVGSGDIDGDREQQRRKEQMERGIYEFSFGNDEFDVTMKY